MMVTRRKCPTTFFVIAYVHHAHRPGAESAGVVAGGDCGAARGAGVCRLGTALLEGAVLPDGAVHCRELSPVANRRGGVRTDDGAAVSAGPPATVVGGAVYADRDRLDRRDAGRILVVSRHPDVARAARLR